LSSHLSNRQKHNKSIYSSPFPLFSNLHVVHPLIHDQGWHPRLAGRPRATRRHPCPDRVPPGRELRRLLCQFAWKLAGSLSCKSDWLSFGGFLVNLSVLPHVRVTSSLCSSIRSRSGVQCPFWCVIWTTSNVNSNILHTSGYADQI
jgi:hypothetical protein